MFYAIMAAVAAAIVGLDQWTKQLTRNAMESTNGSAHIDAIPGLFHITHAENTGAAWSMLEGQTWLFILMVVIFFVALVFLIRKKIIDRKFEMLCLAAISGGAVGNLIDRLLHGSVTDMIALDFIDFPIFNVADSFITVGCIALAVYVLFFHRDSPSEPPAQSADDTPT